MKDFNRAVGLAPGHAGAYFARGYAKELSGETLAALKDYFAAVDIDPCLKEAYKNCEIILRKLKNGGFEDEYNAAENYDFKFEEAYLARAGARYEMKNYEGAVEDLRRLSKLKPDDYRPYKYIGVIEYNLGNFEKAAENFSMAVELGREEPELYFFRAITENRTGGYAGAQKDLDFVIEKQPRNGKAYLARALVKEARRDYKSARKDLNKADALGVNLAYVNINEISFDLK